MVEAPLSYDFQTIQSTLKMQNLKRSELIAAFKSLDFKVSQSYYDPVLYKTDAPPEVIYDIFKIAVSLSSLKQFIEK